MRFVFNVWAGCPASAIVHSPAAALPTSPALNNRTSQLNVLVAAFARLVWSALFGTFAFFRLAFHVFLFFFCHVCVESFGG